MDPAVIETVLREMGALQSRTRSTRRALRVMQDDLDQRTLGTFVLGPGERVDGSEVLDFLRLTAGGAEQEVTLTITARRGTDKETP